MAARARVLHVQTNTKQILLRIPLSQELPRNCSKDTMISVAASWPRGKQAGIQVQKTDFISRCTTRFGQGKHGERERPSRILAIL